MAELKEEPYLAYGIILILQLLTST